MKYEILQDQIIPHKDDAKKVQEGRQRRRRLRRTLVHSKYNTPVKTHSILWWLTKYPTNNNDDNKEAVALNLSISLNKFPILQWTKLVVHPFLV